MCNLVSLRSQKNRDYKNNNEINNYNYNNNIKCCNICNTAHCIGNIATSARYEKLNIILMEFGLFLAIVDIYLGLGCHCIYICLCFDLLL